MPNHSTDVIIMRSDAVKKGLDKAPSAQTASMTRTSRSRSSV